MSQHMHDMLIRCHIGVKYLPFVREIGVMGICFVFVYSAVLYTLYSSYIL